MKLFATVPLALAAVASVASAEDVLYSSRLSKRGIDAQGHFNMCTQVIPRNAPWAANC
jgi:hypothetical protein